jgi:hypothetical protein
MNIKDSILTGFGAGVLAVKDAELLTAAAVKRGCCVRRPPEIVMPDGDFKSCAFYLGTDDPGDAMFAEYMSARFIETARKLNEAGKTVYIVTKNTVMPSYDEVTFEKARREGVIVINLEEGETFSAQGGGFRVTGPGRDLTLDADRIVSSSDYRDHFKGREFLSISRSEPQLRWNPTRWSRKRYHIGFLRHPRDRRWKPREVLGALARSSSTAKKNASTRPSKRNAAAAAAPARTPARRRRSTSPSPRSRSPSSAPSPRRASQSPRGRGRLRRLRPVRINMSVGRHQVPVEEEKHKVEECMAHLPAEKTA